MKCVGAKCARLKSIVGRSGFAFLGGRLADFNLMCMKTGTGNTFLSYLPELPGSLAPSVIAKIFPTDFSRAASRALTKLGIATPAQRPMIARTIIVSTSVKPDLRLGSRCIGLKGLRSWFLHTAHCCLGLVVKYLVILPPAVKCLGVKAWRRCTLHRQDTPPAND